jgi:hypothetical protein
MFQVIQNVTHNGLNSVAADLEKYIRGPIIETLLLTSIYSKFVHTY